MPRLRSRSRVSCVAVGRGVAGASTEGWALPWPESWAWADRIFLWAAGEKGGGLLVSLQAQDGNGDGVQLVSPTSPPTPSPRRPASWSWIFSISMGVVTITWQVPAPQPASISLNRVSFCLQ